MVWGQDGWLSIAGAILTLWSKTSSLSNGKHKSWRSQKASWQPFNTGINTGPVISGLLSNSFESGHLGLRVKHPFHHQRICSKNPLPITKVLYFPVKSKLLRGRAIVDFVYCYLLDARKSSGARQIKTNSRRLNSKTKFNMLSLGVYTLQTFQQNCPEMSLELSLWEQTKASLTNFKSPVYDSWYIP